MESNIPRTSVLKSKNWLNAVVPAWTTLLIVIFVISGWRLIGGAKRLKQEAILRHAERLSDPGETAVKSTKGLAPVEVRAGIYVDRVSQLSIKETGWTVDFYIWFHWKEGDITPGETFQIVDGEIESRDKKKEEKMPDGSFYAMYRVKGRMTKFFNISRFPADDHVLAIRIEDKALPVDRLRYVADKENSAISSRVKFPGYQDHHNALLVNPHSYKTTLGDPRSASGSQATFSQLVFAISIKREGMGFYLKLFQGLFAAVAISLLAFCIKPTDVDPRFGLGVGAFFAAVANCYITASLLPDTAVVSLADTVNGFALGTIFLTLVQSTLSLYLYDIRGEEAMARRLDKASLLIIGVGYTVINIAIPWAAMI